MGAIYRILLPLDDSVCVLNRYGSIWSNFCIRGSFSLLRIIQVPNLVQVTEKRVNYQISRSQKGLSVLEGRSDCLQAIIIINFLRCLKGELGHPKKITCLRACERLTKLPSGAWLPKKCLKNMEWRGERESSAEKGKNEANADITTTWILPSFAPSGRGRRRSTSTPYTMKSATSGQSSPKSCPEGTFVPIQNWQLRQEPFLL